MEEHSIIVEGDVLMGNYAESSYGLIADTVVIGEHAKVNGNIISENDLRIDMWSEITGDVSTKTDAYLGEFVRVNGKLFASGNLDVGNNVKINGGYDVKGWLVVRNPLPVVLFVVLYMMALFRLGNEEEVEKALEELFTEDLSCNRVFSVPNRSKISLETIRTTSSAIVGNHCRLTGNIRARAVAMGNHITLFGSVRTKGNISIGSSCTIHGNLESRKTIKIGRNCKILGKINADSVILHETAEVDGNVSTMKGVTIEHDDLEGLDEIEKRLFYGLALIESS